ncbi:MAG: UMP kinase [Phycisphaerae bacterium]
MASDCRYRRVLVKISGEALSGTGEHGLKVGPIESMLDELADAHKTGAQIALVVGAGNILRGRDLKDMPAVQRTTADSMGMLATVINALALGDLLASRGLDARVLSAIQMTPHCEPFVRARAVKHLQAGRIVVLAGGTGSPFFTTDMCAALRAAELDCDVLIKATKVDGVFDADPVKNPQARRYDTLSYQKVLADRLGVMDLTAISMCMENGIPVMVFQLDKPGNLAAALNGKPVGTLVTDTE